MTKNDWLKKAEKLFSEIPAGTWIFCADKKLYLMRYSNGKRLITENGAMDSNAIIGSITGPEIDGGAW